MTKLTVFMTGVLCGLILMVSIQYSWSREDIEKNHQHLIKLFQLFSLGKKSKEIAFRLFKEKSSHEDIFYCNVKGLELREMETNNHPILLVFLSVFCVAVTVT